MRRKRNGERHPQTYSVILTSAGLDPAECAVRLNKALAIVFDEIAKRAEVDRGE